MKIAIFSSLCNFFFCGSGFSLVMKNLLEFVAYINEKFYRELLRYCVHLDAYLVSGFNSRFANYFIWSNSILGSMRLLLPSSLD